jgi:hypothetical protein
MFKHLVYYKTHPDMFLKGLLFHLSPLIPDEQYVKIQSRIWKSGGGNLSNPQSFNDKLNWMKINYHNPRFTSLVDKYAVKKEVERLIGKKYVVENYGVWDSFDSIPFEQLPEQFVLKATHNSSVTIICRDKSKFDYSFARKSLEKDLKTNYYLRYREWPYKDVPRRILADKLLDDNTGTELRDYKFWCFEGIPRFVYFTIKSDEIYENFYDMDFNPVDINHGFPRHEPEFEKPECFEEMKQLAAKLSQGIPFVRIDFFYVSGQIYFAEYTFYDWGGTRAFKTEEMDLKLGEYIQLPEPIK